MYIYGNSYTRHNIRREIEYFAEIKRSAWDKWEWKKEREKDKRKKVNKGKSRIRPNNQKKKKQDERKPGERVNETNKKRGDHSACTKIIMGSFEKSHQTNLSYKVRNFQILFIYTVVIYLDIQIRHKFSLANVYHLPPGSVRTHFFDLT